MDLWSQVPEMFENSIIRKARVREKPYFLIARSVMQDRRLSVKARGLMGYILSLPDTWQVRFVELTRHFPDGKFAIRSAFNELKKYGYVVSQRVKDEKGIIRGHEFLVFEDPGNQVEEHKDHLLRYDRDPMYRQDMDGMAEKAP